MTELTGGCLCGAVRYRAEGAPLMVGVCHCRDCQKFTGSAFGFLVGIAKAGLAIAGAVKTYAKTGDSGKPILRLFCPECGSSLAEEPTARSGVVILNGGTLDDPAALAPTRQIYCDRELPWVHLGSDIERHARMPGDPLRLAE